MLKLCTEATNISKSFKINSTKLPLHKLKHHISGLKGKSQGYLYRRCTVDEGSTPFDIVVRAEVDAYTKTSTGEPRYVSMKTFN